MQAAKTPAAQKRPPRIALQELQLQPSADRTGLTPLFHRLRLKDHDCATPVSRAWGSCSRVTKVPCTPGPLRSATLLPPSSTTSMPCTPGPQNSTTLEPSRTSTLGPHTSELPRTPTLKPGASEAPSNPTLMPGALEPTSSTSPEAPGSPIPKVSIPKHPDNTVPAPLCSLVQRLSNTEPSSITVPASMCSSIPDPSTLEPSGNTVSAPPCNSIPVPSTLESPGNTVPAPLCNSIPVPSTLESPGNTVPAPLCNSIPVPSTLESPGNTVPAPLCNSIPVPSTPKSPSSAMKAPLCSSIIGPCTPGPPGTSSTPQNISFHGWQVAHPDFSCSPVASESPAGDRSTGPLPCQGTPEGAESPAPAPPEQSPPGLASTGTSVLEPAGSEAAIAPVTSPESAPGAVSWMLPLEWLEKTLNVPSLMESLQHNLLLHMPQQDANCSVTPVSTMVTGTSKTPVANVDAGTSTTPVASVVTGTSTTPVASVVTGTSTTPVASVVTGTSTTPVASGVASTFMTIQDLWERSINRSGGGLLCAKDSATETDSLLWRCPREELKTLPRAELEGRLESTLIIIEALALQLRGLQGSQRLLPGVGPAEQRDVITQTDITRPEGEEEIYHHLYLEQWKKTAALQRQRGAEQDLQQELELAAKNVTAWRSQCLLFRGLVDAAFQRLQDEKGALTQEQEQVRALVSRCKAVLERVPSKLKSCLEERDAMRQRADEALRAKEEGCRFLEAFRTHASAQISARDQSLASQRELCTLLAEAIDLQKSLSAEAQAFRKIRDVTFENLQKERKAMNVEREQVRALMSRCKAVLERVPSKLRSCLEERDAKRQQADEALQAKEEVSHQLQETSMALQNAEAQLEQLTVANSHLTTDLSSAMTNHASVEQERDALQQDNKKQQEKMDELARENKTLKGRCDELCQELLEATEWREFLDQENNMSRMQLQEVEARLKSTQAALQERTLQHEKLMDSHQRLREEQATLSKEVESTKAELLNVQMKRSKVSWCSKDIAECHTRLQELADCLKAALEEQDNDDAPSRSKAWTPAGRATGWQTPRRAWTPAFRTPAHRTPHCTGSSFVGSVLKAMSGKDASEATRGGSAVTKDKLTSTPKPEDPEESLLESVKELKAVVSNLAMLSFRIQELEQSEFKALQMEISDLQLRLETVTEENQEKMDAQAATIAKLNKALRTKIESEKELQDVVKQQEEKMLKLIDKSGEVTMLKEEVSQLKRSLQRAETEAKVLWEEMREKEPKVDTAHVQDRVWLRQEVDKLRLLLLEKRDEKRLLYDKCLAQEAMLRDVQKEHMKELRTHEEMKEKMKEVLSAVPEVVVVCQEFQSLLRYLGLKPDSKEAAEPLPQNP
ncbi:sperm-associated antigen 5 isoform X2 [Chiroxiphia lanceolata]|uniref:sperm-associated antigen 5 isoform X2 n=1 Tax=Chiroxiphia lanceolata TaxID=296741 RepID=UPI0013CF08B8|nr:sperm-associated antigen 5 isoform X2 [Chiroxiphia lanceolata]